MTRRILLTILTSLLAVLTSMAQSPTTEVESGDATAETALTTVDTDSLTVSFLTCSPGDQIHRLYGHTALRMVGDTEDWAVNFGWFSFNTPNFVMKFILGLTDYSMAYQTMPIFIMDLVRDDMGVTEQTLNLTPEEAKYVRKAMEKTLHADGFDRHDYTFGTRPDGTPQQESILAARWIYRYNFLYDNCTTRAVQAIEEAIKASGETLVYPSLANANSLTTQRNMIHEYTAHSPWYEFGQDLLLGPEVDETHTVKELAEGLNFLPVYAQNFFDKAQIRSTDGTMRPLVMETRSLTPFLQPKERKPALPITPQAAAGMVLAVAIVITFNERKANRQAARMNATTPAQRAWRIWGNAFDITGYVLQGIVGLLLVVMVGWSQHPAVGTNWLLLIFNPIFFVGIAARLCSNRTLQSAFAWFACLMALGIIIVGALGLQCIPPAIYGLAIAIGLRAKPLSVLRS